MLVREMYEDAILYEESILAHSLYHLLAEKKISLDDDISKIDLNQVDEEKVGELNNKNILGIQKVRIYSLKKDKKTFIFIYAHSQEEAIDHYIQTFQTSPLNCHEYPLEFELTRGNGVISFREMKKEFDNFPAIAGHNVKGSDF